MRTQVYRIVGRLLAPVLILALAFGGFVPAAAANGLQNTQGFRQRVTLPGVREHQKAFQKIADAHNGLRASGTPGYDASAQYVYDRMRAAGYHVRFQEFTFLYNGDRTPPRFERLTTPARTYVNGVDYRTYEFSGGGEVTAEVQAVDLLVPSPAANSSTSGCEVEDFAGFVSGNIALMQRGVCPYRQKVENALAAGASAFIIFNEGDSPERSGAINGTLNAPRLDLIVVGASTALGDELRNGRLNGPTGITVHLRTDAITEERPTRNVIAETPRGDPNHVVVIGAHLDSETAGPGIQDNGSGSAAILEIAEVYAAQNRRPRNQLRFIWFGAEEFNLLGSAYYVSSLTSEEIARIELNLNFDMIGSPNFVRFVYDGDNSAFPPGPGAAVGPPGSGAIEQLFLDYFASEGLPVEPTPFSGRSDYGPFIAVGIPAGGLFTGAEDIKTPEQAAVYGGTAGVALDPCYHLACDTYDNVSLEVLDQFTDAAAHAVLVYSRWHFDKRPLADAAVTAVSAAAAVAALARSAAEAQ